MKIKEWLQSLSFRTGVIVLITFDSAKNEYRVVGEKVGTAWGSGKTIQEREVK